MIECRLLCLLCGRWKWVMGLPRQALFCGAVQCQVVKSPEYIKEKMDIMCAATEAQGRMEYELL